MPNLAGELSQAQALVALAKEAELFCSDDEIPFATVPVGAHRETLPIHSQGFKRWLARRFHETRHHVASGQALTDALVTLEGLAQYGTVGAPARRHAVFVRVGQRGGTIFLDLGGKAHEVVEIRASGWRVLSDSPVKFRRPPGLAPLPRPTAGGGLDDLKPFINLANGPDWYLFVAWLLGAMHPSGPYPVLVVHGEQGSAKTTLGRIARELIDPNGSPLRAEPRNEQDLAIAAANAWVLAFDNVSHLTPWRSDAFCRVSTGGGFSTRKLYSDAEEALFNIKRPLILNGIAELATQGDLVDRALFLYLPQIPKDRRRDENEFWQAFGKARSRILGALLDAVSGALAKRSTMRLAGKPRMADFALWVTSAEPRLGWPPGTFLAAYEENRRAADELTLAASPVAAAIRDFVAIQRTWEGTATALLAELNVSENEVGARRQKAWPGSPQELSNDLRRLEPNLRRVGIEVEFGREADPKRTRFIRLRKVEPSAVHVVQALDAPDGLDTSDLLRTGRAGEEKDVIDGLEVRYAANQRRKRAAVQSVQPSDTGGDLADGSGGGAKAPALASRQPAGRAGTQQEPRGHQPASSSPSPIAETLRRLNAEPRPWERP
jgi:hypothetical protein